MCGTLRPAGRRLHASRDDVEAQVLAALFAHAEQGLLAHADAEEGPAAGDVVADGRDKAAVLQVAHRIAGGADAGQDQRFGARDGLRFAADEGLVAAVRDGARDAAQVPRPVIDDDDLLHFLEPFLCLLVFVDGEKAINLGEERFGDFYECIFVSLLVPSWYEDAVHMAIIEIRD